METNLTLPRAWLTSIPDWRLALVFDDEIGLTMFSLDAANTISGAWVGSVKMASYHVLKPRN